MRLPATASRAMLAPRPTSNPFCKKSPAVAPLICSPLQLRRCCRCQAEGTDAEESEGVKTELEKIIRRKADEIQDQVDALGGIVGLEEKLRDSVEAARLPEDRQFRFGRLLTDALPQRKVLLVAEVPRNGLPAEAPEQLAHRATLLAKAGVDVLTVHTDAAETPCGLRDLFAVVRAVPKTPVFRRDWFIHPLQVVEAKEAGAAGVLGIVTQVSGQGTPVLSAFAATMGIDAPVEVVNTRELDYLVESGVAILAMACGVGLSVTLPGYARDAARGLLQHLPPSCASLVGVADIDAAREASQQGASALLLRASMLEAVCDDEVACRELVRELKYQVSGDD